MCHSHQQRLVALEVNEQTRSDYGGGSHSRLQCLGNKSGLLLYGSVLFPPAVPSQISWTSKRTWRSLVQLHIQCKSPSKAPLAGSFYENKMPSPGRDSHGGSELGVGNAFLQQGSCSSSGQTRSLPRIHAWQAEHRRMESHPTPCRPGDSSQPAGSDPCRGHLAGAEMTWGTSLLTATEMPVQPLAPIFPPFLLAPSFSVVLSGQNGIGS